MCSAPTQVILHALDDFFAGGFRVPQQKTIGVKNHTRCTETALKSIVLYKRFLNWMQFPVLCQAFDGKNIFTFDAPDGKHT
jgi:hypothetical protein